MKSYIRAVAASGSTQRLVERLIASGWTPENRRPIQTKSQRRKARQAVSRG
jgi:hypothetical protein